MMYKIQKDFFEKDLIVFEKKIPKNCFFRSPD